MLFRSAYRLLFGIAVQVPGYFVYSLFLRAEYDPDKRVEVDPTGIISSIVGILSWALLLGAAYGIYQLAR